MKKLGKKELEIVVGEVSKEICKVKKEKLIEKFESSEEGKGIRKLENLINESLVEVNVNLNKLKGLKEVFENRELGGFGYGLLDLEVEKGRFKDWGVDIKVGRDYNGGYSSSRNKINEEVERELILEGLKGASAMMISSTCSAHFKDSSNRSN